ncbi:mandelate racemase/muconate lactonizing enzyme family protein [Streptomonospora sp. S1-112]|uniref:Mandelate racemase/muconate lactonizing enzyme family protein n=1 Tax=Streptomonospora mangrovi TaxID=2883123 RepID=A0A9X3NP43_9ACTN|nr:mandelate racemase/muconate lactonizing enzyme family protein [Streptomonospora mangrovi]MDA0566957.1 mandelate racemase/muconate lactonizing enzyme family protein [Streptomonospora mangrovi]
MGTAAHDTVAGLAVRTLELPLHRAWDGGVTHNHLVITRLTTASGAEGTGFAWTPRVGVGAVRALLEEDCPAALVGRPPDPGPRWADLTAHLADAGSGGLAAMAVAAVDIALWDLAARRAERGLVGLIGARRSRVAAYGSGVNLDYDLPDLLEQVRGWLAAGHRAVKVKVGSADLERDVERVAQVRRVLGPGRRLMLDANQRWDLPAAVRALRALERFEPYWVEEPLPAEDLAAHVELRRRTAVPFAIGENLRTVRAFEAALAAGVCDIAQPNAVRVGGITPFLRIAELAAHRGVPVAPHLLPELSAQLALCVPRAEMVEDIDRASFAALGALAAPSGVRITGGWAEASTGPGHGLRFREADSAAG